MLKDNLSILPFTVVSVERNETFYYYYHSLSSNRESLLLLFIIVSVRLLQMYIRLLVTKYRYIRVIFVTSTESQVSEVQISSSLNIEKKNNLCYRWIWVRNNLIGENRLHWNPCVLLSFRGVGRANLLWRGWSSS